LITIGNSACSDEEMCSGEVLKLLGIHVFEGEDDFTIFSSGFDGFVAEIEVDACVGKNAFYQLLGDEFFAGKEMLSMLNYGDLRAQTTKG